MGAATHRIPGIARIGIGLELGGQWQAGARGCQQLIFLGAVVNRTAALVDSRLIRFKPGEVGGGFWVSVR